MGAEPVRPEPTTVGTVVAHDDLVASRGHSPASAATQGKSAPTEEKARPVTPGRRMKDKMRLGYDALAKRTTSQLNQPPSKASQERVPNVNNRPRAAFQLHGYATACSELQRSVPRSSASASTFSMQTDIRSRRRARRRDAVASSNETTPQRFTEGELVRGVVMSLFIRRFNRTLRRGWGVIRDIGARLVLRNGGHRSLQLLSCVRAP